MFTLAKLCLFVLLSGMVFGRYRKNPEDPILDGKFVKCSFLLNNNKQNINNNCLS